MATKLVNDVDDSVWRQFAGKCKMENEKVGILLTKLMKDYLRR